MAIPELVPKRNDKGEEITINIQRTSLGIDALARFFCNTYDEVKAVEGDGFDVIVIGSGMYGSYFASKIFTFSTEQGKQIRVLVLEAGPFVISEHFQNLTNAGDIFGIPEQVLVDDNRKNIISAASTLSQNGDLVKHHKCVGGKSLFWGGWSPELTDEDLKLWPKEVRDYLKTSSPDDGYNFINKEIGVYPDTDFIKGALSQTLLEKVKQIIIDNKVKGLNNAIIAPIAAQGESPESGLFSFDKFSSLPLLTYAIREDIELARRSNPDINNIDPYRNIFLVPNTEVIKLETKDGIVSEVLVVQKSLIDDGKQSEVQRLKIKPSGQVVLAANTVNSTRLALNSFPRPSVLGDELMGRNLMVHVRGNYFWKLNKTEVESWGTPLPARLETTALHITGSTDKISDLGINRKGQYHFQFYAVGSKGVPTFPKNEDPEQFLYRMLPNFDDIQAVEEAQNSDDFFIGIRTTGEFFGDKNSPLGNPDKSWIGVNPPLGSASDNDTYFENGQPISIPKTYINLIETAADQKVRSAQTKAAQDLIKVFSTTAQPLKKNDEDRNEDGVGTTFHESGTLWMDIDYNKSVTDINGRFHHVANAYVVDQSIFPTVGSANPVPTGLALSRMVARSLMERFQEGANDANEEGFTYLYSGDLSTWIIREGSDFRNFDNVKVFEAGKGTDGKSTNLGIAYFPTEYADFTLKLEWKAFSITANSGIFLRMPTPTNLDDNFYNETVEIQIDERGYDFKNNIYGSPLHKTGAVYEIIAARQWAAKTVSAFDTPGFWNSYEITVKGPRITVLLNNKLVSEGDLPNSKRNRGFVGIQCHTDIVHFRNIRIKEL